MYLIRHGAYDRVDSLSDVTANGLSPLGHEQAAKAAEQLARRDIRRIIVSPYTRALETATTRVASSILPSTISDDR